MSRILFFLMVIALGAYGARRLLRSENSERGGRKDIDRTPRKNFDQPESLQQNPKTGVYEPGSTKKPRNDDNRNETTT